MMMVEFIKNLQLFTSLNSGIDMKPKEFFDAVVRMREKQQEYFKTKTSSALTEQASELLKYKVECIRESIKREPFPPYKERLHPRKHWQRKPYWLRTRSNPKKKGYH